MSDLEGSSALADPYEAVLADLRAKRDDIDRVIRTLEGCRAGAPAVADAGRQSNVKKADEIGPGAFLGMSIVDAAKKLLTRERRQLTNHEILAAIKAGGLVMNAADPLNVVGSILTRRFNGVGDIVRVNRGTWGLKEWYPNRSFKKEVASEEPTTISEEPSPTISPIVVDPPAPRVRRRVRND